MLASRLPGAQGADGALRARWIWYPGQLAAYRQSRLIRLATQRCVHVGYPAKFRQPVTMYRWASPCRRCATPTRNGSNNCR